MCARARGSVPEFWFVSFVLKLVIFFMNISTNNEGRHHFHSIKLLCALYSFIIMLYSITVRGFWGDIGNAHIFNKALNNCMRILGDIGNTHIFNKALNNCAGMLGDIGNAHIFNKTLRKFYIASTYLS